MLATIYLCILCLYLSLDYHISNNALSNISDSFNYMKDWVLFVLCNTKLKLHKENCTQVLMNCYSFHGKLDHIYSFTPLSHLVQL